MERRRLLQCGGGGSGNVGGFWRVGGDVKLCTEIEIDRTEMELKT